MIVRNKSENFKFCNKPRYLIGQVPIQMVKADLEVYNGHLYRVQTATPVVDCKPPKFNPVVYFNPSKLLEDARRLKQLDRENRELLKRLNMISRSPATLDTWTNALCYRNTSLEWEKHIKEMKTIEHHNREFYYKSLTQVHSHYQRKDMKKFWGKALAKLKYMAKMPLVILKKDNPDERLPFEPSICNLTLDAVPPRPTAYLEFRAGNGAKLGRVEILLYMDIVPVTVQNFISLCTGDNNNNLTYKNCKVHRIVIGSHMESGDIVKGNRRGGTSIYGDRFSEEKHVLSHRRAGVLSAIRIDGNQENNSQFSITFRRMESWDKKNVVFGKIVKGMKTLKELQGYGSRYGKPLAPVVISDCGVKSESQGDVIIHHDDQNYER